MHASMNRFKKLAHTGLDKSERRNLIFGLLFASPAILGFLIFLLGPMIASAVFSLTNYSIFAEPRFVGFQNYIDLFSGRDPFFFKSFGVTLYYVALNVPASVGAAFAMALLLSSRIRGKTFFRAVFYLPTVVPVVASMMIWTWMMNPDFGLINNILRALGLPTSLWLYSESTVIPSIVLTGLWSVGGTFVIFLAGLEGIPKQYYEAVEIDGGNYFHKLRHITIPIMTPTIFFNTVMAIIGSFQAFTQAFILTQGGPNNASLFFVYYLWREAFRNTRMGYASAISWVLFLTISILTVVVFKTSNRWVYYEGEMR
jgi:multiple sugar transport system permease protein